MQEGSVWHLGCDTYHHHQRYCLHLNWCWCCVTRLDNIRQQVRTKFVPDRLARKQGKNPLQALKNSQMKHTQQVCLRSDRTKAPRVRIPQLHKGDWPITWIGLAIRSTINFYKLAHRVLTGYYSQHNAVTSTFNWTCWSRYNEEKRKEENLCGQTCLATFTMIPLPDYHPFKQSGCQQAKDKHNSKKWQCKAGFKHKSIPIGTMYRTAQRKHQSAHNMRNSSHLCPVEKHLKMQRSSACSTGKQQPYRVCISSNVSTQSGMSAPRTAIPQRFRTAFAYTAREGSPLNTKLLECIKTR